MGVVILYTAPPALSAADDKPRFASAGYTLYSVSPITQSAFFSAINDSGQVVGWNWGAYSLAYSIVANSDGTITTIPLPSGWSGARACCINNSGQVAGSGGSSGTQAYFYDPSGTSTAIPLAEGWNYSYAYGVSNNGQVTGCGGYWYCSYAFIGTTSSSSPVPSPGTGAIDLSVTGTTGSSINNLGKVTGVATIHEEWGTGCNKSYNCNHSQAFFGDVNSSQLIPLPPQSNWTGSKGTGINDAGNIVGGASLSDGSTQVVTVQVGYFYRGSREGAG
jgi:uncharacterized membrane protein